MRLPLRTWFSESWIASETQCAAMAGIGSSFCKFLLERSASAPLPSFSWVLCEIRGEPPYRGPRSASPRFVHSIGPFFTRPE